MVSNVSKAASGNLSSINANSTAKVSVSDQIKAAVKSTVSTISETMTSLSKTGAITVSGAATSPIVTCGRNNSSNMVSLREWYNDQSSYCKNTYKGFCSSLTWDDKTNTATVYMSGNGYVNYVNIKPGKDGSYIKDGRLYVDQGILWNKLGLAIDPPLIDKSDDTTKVIVGVAVGVKGISSGAKIIKGISAADAAGVGGMSKATRDIIAGYKGDTSHIINGSSGTKSGHAWQALFNGVKPTFEEIKPYIGNVIEKGNITNTQILQNGSKIVYKTMDTNGVEIWTKEFIQNGVSRLSDAGVNKW